MSQEKLSGPRKDRDLQLWKNWKESTEESGSESNPHWEPLLSTVAMPAVHRFVSSYGGKTDIPESTIRSRAVEGAIQGLQTWDPSHKAGAALFTHVTNGVMNHSRRFIQERQGNIRIPEHRGWSKITMYNNGIDDFEAEKGFEPNETQLAEHLGWRLSHVQDMARDLRMSAPGTGSVIQENVSVDIPKDDKVVSELKFQLSGPKDEQKRKVLDLLLSGKNGQQIAKSLSIGESKVSQIRRQLVTMSQRELSRRTP